MVRLTRLRIDRFRNVKPGTELRFGSTFNALLGKNATGKSTLLDLIAAVTNDDLSSYAEEDAGFDLTWWLGEGDHELERKATRTPAQMLNLPERLREEKEFDDVWAMVLRTAGTEAARLEVAGTRGLWKLWGESEIPFDVKNGLASGNAGLWAVLATPRVNPTPMARLRIEELTAGGDLGRFDEAVATLDDITGSSFEVSRKDGRTTKESFEHWLPADLRLAFRAPELPDPVVVPFDALASLAEIPTRLGFESADLRPRVLKRSQEGEKVTITYQGFDCLFRRADGSQISHELLSFGQKRLFAFLWYLAVREREELPVIADELLNGLHHEWIEVCFDRLRDRQSFLATQHPLLLDHIPIESAEAVRTTFIRCSTARDPDGREQMVWRNFNEEEAERFFIAYQTGIQHVSEVLRSEGLW